MRTCEPDAELWQKINDVIGGENAAVATATLLSGLCVIMTSTGVAEDEEDARVVLATMLIAPSGSDTGSLLGKVTAELKRAREENAH